MKNKNKKLNLPIDIRQSTFDNRKGFSLTEMLVVMGIVGLMALVGFGLFRDDKPTTNLITSQRELAAAVKLAQGYAIQGRTQIIDGTQRLPCGYGVRFTNATQYEIFYNKPDTGKNCQLMNTEDNNAGYLHYNATLSAAAESFELNFGVSLSVPDEYDFAGTEIYFTVPHANVYDNSGTALEIKTYELAHAAASATKTVQINSKGAIDED